MAGGFPFRSVQPDFNLSTLLREGYQYTNGSISGSNEDGIITVGTALGGLGPPIGSNLYIDSVAIHSEIDCLIWVQRSDSSLIANSAASNIQPIACGPSYGSQVVPIMGLLREGESISFICRTEIASGAGTNTFQFRGGMNAYRITNDLAFEAPKSMMIIGDSISNTTGPTNGTQYWHARTSLSLKAAGNPYRRIVKGDGGWKTSHALDYLQRGGFDIADPELIMIMLGTNETVLADYQTNIVEIVDYLREKFPDAKMCLVGPPPRQDSIELTVLVPLRAWTDSYVTSLADPAIHFTSLGDSFDRTIASNYIASDGPDGTRIHPTGETHGVMTLALLAEWGSSGFIDLL